MPAGTYHSLRVTIGEGEGKNWWCVLFPTVCVRFAEADEEAYIAAGFTPEEYRIITGSEGKLRIRFRVLEILSELFRHLLTCCEQTKNISAVLSATVILYHSDF